MLKSKVKIFYKILNFKVLENFLALKFPTLKRYSGEGSQAALGFYKYLMEEAPNYGIQEVFYGGIRTLAALILRKNIC